MNTIQLCLLMLFGALGTLCRYLLSSFFNKFFVFPYLWGTTIVNIIGCALFAFVYALSLKFDIPPAYRTICLTGFLGAFTTFSAMMHEAHSLLIESPMISMLYILVHVIIGLAVFQCVLFLMK